MEELLSLKWNNHSSTFLQVLSNIRTQQQFSDVTLICEDKYYEAHRMILSTCSDYFKGIFKKLGHHQGLVIVINGIKCDQLDLLLDYMYLGEVNVKQIDLNALIKASEFLQIKGLAVAEESPPIGHGQSSHKRKPNHSPVAKKRTKLRKSEVSYDSPAPSNQKDDNSPLTGQDNDPIYVAKEEMMKIDVKEEPDDDFSVEEVFIKTDTMPQQSSQDLLEGQKKRCLNYEPQQFESQPPDLLGSESYDSNFSSLLNQDQSTNWEETDLSMNIGNKDLPSTADGSTQPTTTFQCPYCSKNFRFHSKLQTHLRCHTGERPFQCKWCNYAATQSSHLYRHLEWKHSISRNDINACEI